MTTIILSGVGGGTTAFLDFMEVLSANGTPLGLMLSATGIIIGVIFKILDLRETRRSNRENERIRLLQVSD